MVWFRLDDQWLMHPKIRAAGRDGRALWIAGGLHCASHLTDGRIDKITADLLAKMAEVPAKTSAKSLVAAGLWIDHGTHYEMHDYLEYQPARATVEKERAATKERVRAYRNRKSGQFGDHDEESGNGVTPPVTAKPGNGVTTPLVTPLVTACVTPAPTHPVHNSKSSVDDKTLPREAESSSTDPEPAVRVARILELSVLATAVKNGHNAEEIHGWKRGVLKNMREERTPQILAGITEGRTDIQIAGSIVGGETWVRKAMQSPNPGGYA
jgi:hypothetical protein